MSDIVGAFDSSQEKPEKNTAKKRVCSDNRTIVIVIMDLISSNTNRKTITTS